MKEKKLASARVGRVGELVACDFLTTRGYKLVEQNVRYKVGEIDLVMRDPKGGICFVEVKTTAKHIDTSMDNTSAFAGPTEQLHRKKLDRLHKAITYYLHKNSAINQIWQLDAVIVLLDQQNNKAACKHLQHISHEF